MTSAPGVEVTLAQEPCLCHADISLLLLDIKLLASGVGPKMTSADRLAAIATQAESALEQLQAPRFTHQLKSACEAVAGLPVIGEPCQSGACCVCGHPAATVVRDLREMEPAVGGFGTYQRFDLVGPPLNYCDQHRRPALRFMRDGAIETQEGNFIVATARPKEVELEVGKLQIIGKTEGNGRLTTCKGSQVLIDGKPMERVRSVEVRGGINEVWAAKLEFLP